MLVFDLRKMGNALLAVRKEHGMTQAEVAEKAGLSDRTYADIERGTVNMRVETLLKICQALSITPDEILTEAPSNEAFDPEKLLEQLSSTSIKNQKTALHLLSVYLESVN